MKIEKIKIEGFRGIEKFEGALPQLGSLCGVNGIGKTSLLAAIRYLLTGEELGNVINIKTDKAIVSAQVLNNDGELMEITRCKKQNKPTTCKINGHTVTVGELNASIENWCGIAVDKLKILSSADVIAAMKPQDLSAFILDYIPEDLTTELIIGYIQNSTIGMLKICENGLPEGKFGMNEIDKLEQVCREKRKELKKEWEQKKILYKECPKIKPQKDRAAIEKSIEEFHEKEAIYKAYLEKENAYKVFTNNLERYNSSMKEVEEKLSKATNIVKPDENEKAAILAEKKSLTETKTNQLNTKNSMQIALKQLNSTLENLNKPVCPISDKIVCNQDKTKVKAELVETINKTKEGLESLEIEIKKTDDKISENEKRADKYANTQKRYEQYQALVNYKANLEKAKPQMVEKPVKVEAPSAEIKKSLNEELKVLTKYEEGLKLGTQITTLETLVSDYDKMVKALEPKGIVKTSIIEYYLKLFEDICNKKSSNSEYSFKFEAENGIVITMSKNNDDYLPYSSLSGGERAYMLFIIMDMLNELSGTKMLMIDELSVLDKETFSKLLDLLIANKNDYDHVIIASVNHSDIENTIKEKNEFTSIF